MANPMIQVRLHPDVMKRVEERAKTLGYITPSDKANMADYVRSLIMRDINSGVIIIDGHEEEYKVK